MRRSISREQWNRNRARPCVEILFHVRVEGNSAHDDGGGLPNAAWQHTAYRVGRSLRDETTVRNLKRTREVIGFVGYLKRRRQSDEQHSDGQCDPRKNPCGIQSGQTLPAQAPEWRRLVHLSELYGSEGVRRHQDIHLRALRYGG
jgi:hypothetical protein